MTQAWSLAPEDQRRAGALAGPDSTSRGLRAGEGARAPSVFWENLEP